MTEYEWVESYQGDQWECDVMTVGILDGKWWWNVTVGEAFVSGPYPGTPDWKETLIGEGDAESLEDAKAKAISCWEEAQRIDEENQRKEMEYYEREAEILSIYFED